MTIRLTPDEDPLAPEPEPAGQRSGVGAVLDFGQDLLNRAQDAVEASPQFHRDYMTALNAVTASKSLRLPTSVYTEAFDHQTALQLVRADWQAPEARIMSMVAENFDRALAMSNPEILGRLTSGNGVYDPEVTDLLEAMENTTLTTFSVAMYQQQVAQKASTTQGIIDSINLYDESGVGVMDATTMLTEGAFLADYRDREARWTFDPDTRTLAVDADGQGSIVVRLDEGATVTSNNDAIGALIEAIIDGEHTVVRNDPLPGAQTAFGWATQRLGDLAFRNPAGRVASEFVATTVRDALAITSAVTPGVGIPGAPDLADVWQNPLVLDNIRKTAEAERLAELDQAKTDWESIVRFRPAGVGAVMRAIADEAYAQGIDTVDPDTLFAMGEELYAANKDEIDRNLGAMFVSELEQQFSDDEDPNFFARGVVDPVVDTVLSGLQLWDGVAQWIGVTSIDFLADLGMGAVNYLRGDTDEGFRRFANLTERVSAHLDDDGNPVEIETVGDWFGLEGSAKAYADLAGSIAFDPLNVLFAGPSLTRKWYTEMATNPRLAPMFVRTPSMRSAIDTIITGDRARSMRAVLSMEISDRSLFSKLVPFARAEGVERGSDVYKAALREVRQAFIDHLPANGGSFLSAGPMRAVARQNALGMGALFASDDPAAQSLLTKLLANASTDRAISLGEHGMIDDFFNRVVQWFADDADGMLGWADEMWDALDLADATRAVKSGAANAKQAELVERARLLRQQKSLLTKDAKKITADDLADLLAERDALDDVVEHAIRGEVPDPTDTDLRTIMDDFAVDEPTARALWESQHRFGDDEMLLLDDRLTELTDEITKVRGLVDEKVAAAAEIAKEQTRVKLFRDALDSQNDRLPIIDTIYRFYHKVGEDLDLPLRKVGGKTVKYPGSTVDMHDWSAVTGKSRQIMVQAGEAEGVVPSSGFGFVGTMEEADTARKLDVFFNANPNWVQAPASMMEILGYRALQTNPKKWGALLRGVDAAVSNSVSRTVRTVWGMNLLLNVVTPFKANLDEVVRFAAENGLSGMVPTLRAAAAGAPGIGAAFTGELSPWAEAYGRQLSGLTQMTTRPYVWLAKPSRGKGFSRFVDAGKRWLGVVTNDDAFKAYARAVAEGGPATRGGVTSRLAPDSFRRWWNEIGVHQRRTISVAGEKIQVVTADDAWRVMDDSWALFTKNLLNDSDAGRRAAAEVLRIAREGGGAGEVFGEELIRAFRQVPGVQWWDDSQNAMGRYINAVFEPLYGSPANRRGSIFFDQYYDEAYNILSTGARNRERLITAQSVKDWLATKGTIVDIDAAQDYIRRADWSSIVKRMVTEDGFVLDTTLQARAAQYARRRADDLMYRMTATSVLGSKVDNPILFPFARAQNDFMSWWMRWLFKPTQLRIGPESRMFLDDHAAPLLKAIEKVESVPVNFRTWGRLAHMATAMSDDQETVFESLVDKFTFLPLKFGTDMLMELYPQAGPVSDFVTDLPGVRDTPLQSVSEAVFPGHSFTDYMADGTLQGLVNLVTPQSSRSVRKAAGVMVRGAQLLAGHATDPTKAGFTEQVVSTLLAFERTPIGTADLQAASFGQFLGSDGLTAAVGSAEWTDAITKLNQDALYTAAKTAAINDGLKALWPLTSTVESQHQALNNYTGLYAERERLHEMGILTDQDIEEMEPAWERFQSGNATDNDTLFLGDLLSTTLFDRLDEQTIDGFDARDWMLVHYPSMAERFVSKFECGGNAPNEWKFKHCNPQTGTTQNWADGRIGLEQREEALQNGWMVFRDPADWMADANRYLQDAAIRYTNTIWRGLSGREWSQGMTKATEAKTLELPQVVSDVFAAVGIDVPPGRTNLGELRDYLSIQKGRWYSDSQVGSSIFSNNSLTAVLSADTDTLSERLTGADLLAGLKQIEKGMKDNGFSQVRDWPDDLKAAIRTEVSTLVDAGVLTLGDYQQNWERYFGDLDYQPPQPPPLRELTDERSIPVPKEWSIPGSGLAQVAQVIDGDSVKLLLPDGEFEVRLLGVNAPDEGEEGYEEAEARLDAFLQSHDVEFRVWEPDRFGLDQRIGGEGKRRWKLWMYVDGVPVFDPATFTVDNPTGRAKSSRVVPDFEGMLAREKARLGLAEGDGT